MKKIIHLSVALFICSAAFGQLINPPAAIHQFPQPSQKIDNAQYQQLRNHHSQVAFRSLPTISLDYDAVDEFETTNQGGTYQRFIWDLNTNYEVADTNRFALTWGVVRFDTIIGLDTTGNITSYPRSASSFSLDSVQLFFTHENTSGTADTIQLSVYQWQGTSGIQVDSQEEITNPVLYDTMIITTTSLSPGASQLATLTIYPNLQLSYPNNRFLVGVHFYGDTLNNTFTVLAGNGDRCAAACQAFPSVIDLNSLWRLIAWTGQVNLTGINSIAYDCDANGIVGDSAACEEFNIQNFVITPFLTINGLSLVASSTPASCNVADGTASVSAAGGSGNYSYQWTTADTTQTITGLTAGFYTVTVTDDSSGGYAIARVEVTGYCGTISGNVFEDSNGNGVKDGSETGYRGIRVDVNPGGYHTYTNQFGSFSVDVSAYDTYAVEVSAPYRYYCNWTFYGQDSISYPPGGIHTATVDSVTTSVTGLQFGIAPLSAGCGMVQGNVFEDANSNGIKDPGELGQSGVYIVTNTGIATVSDFNGDYSFEVPFNTAITVETDIYSQNFYCYSQPFGFTQTFPTNPPNYTVTVTPSQPVSTGNDFGVNNTSPAFDAGVFNISPDACNAAGRDFYVWMDYKTDGVITDTCRIRLTFDPLVEFISSSIPPSVITTTYVEWAYAPGSVPTWFCMQMEFNLDSSAVAGTELTWTGTYNCGSADACPGNDTLVRTSYVLTGPVRLPGNAGLNSMSVYHFGNSQNEITAADSSLSYVIFFQNTGHDSVFHMTIVDTLSPYLNPLTISRPFSSQPYSLYMPSPDVLVWEFDNIKMPDSTTNYLKSYGFVQFNIYLKPNVQAGTEIDNEAAIGFNYGQPYFTNKASVTIVEDIGIHELSTGDLKIYPNPGSGRIIVELPESFEKEAHVSLLNLLGTTLLDRQVNGQPKVELNLSEVPPGIYLLKAESKSASIVGKVVLER